MPLKKLTFVCGEAPFPPINGVRIPTAHMIGYFSKFCAVNVVIITDKHTTTSVDTASALAGLGVSPPHTITYEKQSLFRRLFNLVFLFKPTVETLFIKKM